MKKYNDFFLVPAEALSVASNLVRKNYFKSLYTIVPSHLLTSLNRRILLHPTFSL